MNIHRDRTDESREQNEGRPAAAPDADRSASGPAQGPTQGPGQGQGHGPVKPDGTAPAARPASAPDKSASAPSAPERSASAPSAPDRSASAPDRSASAPSAPEKSPGASPDRAGLPGQRPASAPQAEGAGARTPRAAAQDTAEEIERLGRRMERAVGGFVDDPRRAVKEADAVLEETAGRLARLLEERRQGLRESWHADDDTRVGTEELRITLTRYRDMTRQLLNVG
jgi:hypothetical protein